MVIEKPQYQVASGKVTPPPEAIRPSALGIKSTCRALRRPSRPRCRPQPPAADGSPGSGLNEREGPREKATSMRQRT